MRSDDYEDLEDRENREDPAEHREDRSTQSTYAGGEVAAPVWSSCCFGGCSGW